MDCFGGYVYVYTWIQKCKARRVDLEGILCKYIARRNSQPNCKTYFTLLYGDFSSDLFRCVPQTIVRGAKSGRRAMMVPAVCPSDHTLGMLPMPRIAEFHSSKGDLDT